MNLNMILAIFHFVTSKVSTTMNFEEISHSVKSDFIRMVLGANTNSIESQLKLFTNSDLRKNTQNCKTVHKNGVKRCPHLNHFTGAVAMFMNLKVLQLCSSPEVLSVFARVYQTTIDKLGMCYGPPSLLIKPEFSGPSSPFVFSFKNHSSTLKYTGLMSLTSHSKDTNSAGVQKLVNFDLYYDILATYFNFDSHCLDGSILYLEKWFSVECANRMLEEYTHLYNNRHRNIPYTLNRPIAPEIISVYNTTHLEVPQNFTPLHWSDVPMPQGELKLFSSREAIKTLACKDQSCARVYVQIPIEVIPDNWQGSEEQLELLDSYKTGRFGNWYKPGKRCYIRENKSECEALSREQINQVWQFVQTRRSVFGL